jgi:1-acyl-sn-glycerol-3-phosphate acyltransferase
MLALLLIIFIQYITLIAASFYLCTGLDLSWHVDKFITKLLFDIRVLRHHESASVNPSTKIILANHRSFTDFFFDSYLIGYASQLSRITVALVMPPAGFYGWISGRVLFFKRGATGHRQLGSLIKKHFKTRPAPMVIYPEGHRNKNPESLPIKHGGIKMCFEQGWPVQLSIVRNKENVLDEKTLSMKRGISCFWYLSEIIDPKECQSPEDFYERVLTSWEKSWKIAYDSDQKEFSNYEIPYVEPKFDFSWRWLLSWGVLFTVSLGYYAHIQSFF